MIRIGGYYIVNGEPVKITEFYKGYAVAENLVQYEPRELGEIALTRDIFERNGYTPKYEAGGVVYLKNFKNGGEIRAKYEGGVLYPNVAVRNGNHVHLGRVESWQTFCDILKACKFKEEFRCV